MGKTEASGKITAEHLNRKAVVYLRQSSEQQVRLNTESQRLQYSLADRARELGFQQVEVIDQDLGASAALGAKERKGFQQLIAAIALGQVGMVLSREVSRLSRTDRDWCQLQEVCQVFGVLLADAERVYDLSSLDDQLVLGIKGTMSVMELKVLKMRLMEGMQAKARRGELFRKLAPGYVQDGQGHVVKDPDVRVAEAIALVFRKFGELQSVRQTYLWFHHQGIELPVNKSQGDGPRIIWKLPSHSFVAYVLRNPFYAGAYVYGQRPSQMRWVDGKLVKVTAGYREPEDCDVFIRDHHEGYISWAEYEENRRRMRGNNLKIDPDASVAAVRSGHGLLTRLLRCGRCGRKLHVRYWGRAGTAARYVCGGDYDQGGSYCLAFGGSTVDRRFGEELLRVISPLGMAASLHAVESCSQATSDERRALERQLQEAEYAARRAFEQYDEVDPRNRLVAAELEQRWNATLAEVERLTATLEELDPEPVALTMAEQEAILALGEDFARVWESPDCPPQLKKRIVATVVEEVLVDEKATEMGSQLVFTIHWKGGSHTQFEMPKPRSGIGGKTALEDVDIIRRMAVRYGDDQIARVLTKLKRRTATGKRWNVTRVASVRQRYGISGRRHARPDPEILTLAQAAAYGGVSDTTIRRLVEAEVLECNQVVPWAPWEIRREDLDAGPVRSLLQQVRETGKLDLKGVRSAGQGSLFDRPHREEQTQVS